MPSKPTNTVNLPTGKPPKEKSHMNAITLFSAIILVIIVVTFIGAPVVSRIAGSSNVTFGYYDGIAIDYLPGNYFAQQVEQYSRYYEQFKNTNVNLERQLVWRQAFEQAAQRIALKDQADKAGIVVTDGAVDKVLVNYPAFQKDGHFSTELYRATAADDMMRYRKDAATQMLIQTYASDQISGPMLPDQLTNFVQSMVYPQRKLSFVVFNSKDFPESEVTAYAKAHQKLFRSLDLSKITLSSQGDAQQVREQALKGTKSFEDLAKMYSKDSLAQSGGAMNTLEYHELLNQIPQKELDAIFALGKGQISQVYQDGKQWVFYKVISAATEPDWTADSTMSDVRNYIQTNDRGVLEDYLMKQAKAFSSSAQKDFTAAAKAISKKVETTSYVSLNFDNLSILPGLTKASTDPAFQSLAANPSFFKKVFSLAKGQVSEPVLSTPSVLVFHVDDLRDAPASASTPASPSDKTETAKTKVVPDEPAPISSDELTQLAQRYRSQALEQNLLKTPLFKDDFDAAISHLR